MPILLYIGLLIGAQAFQAVPRRHAVAVVVALIPNIASWATGQIDNAVGGGRARTPAEVGERGVWRTPGVVYHGTAAARAAARSWPAWCSARSSCSSSTRSSCRPRSTASWAPRCRFVGLIHAEKVGWNVGGQVALGYLFAGIILLAFAAFTRGTPVDGEPEDGSEGVPAPRETEESPAPVMAPLDTTRPATA